MLAEIGHGSWDFGAVTLEVMRSARMILDIQACTPQRQSPITKADAVADKIVAKLPR
jgi:hypothetical protein